MLMDDVRLSHHALRRYIERVKPGIGIGAARRELRALIPFATLEAEVPWHHNSDDNDAYLVVSDGIALGLTRSEDGCWIAATVLTRGGHSEEVTQRKRAAKAARRAAKRRKREGTKSDGRPFLPQHFRRGQPT